MSLLIKLPLTDQQQMTFKFITDFFSANEYPPNIPEIQKAMGFKNPGHVYKILHYLQKKGYIVRNKGEHRGIRLTDDLVTTKVL